MPDIQVGQEAKYECEHGHLNTAKVNLEGISPEMDGQYCIVCYAGLIVKNCSRVRAMTSDPRLEGLR